jgi:hypothetical protein
LMNSATAQGDASKVGRIAICEALSNGVTIDHKPELGWQAKESNFRHGESGGHYGNRVLPRCCVEGWRKVLAVEVGRDQMPIL